MAGSAPVAQLGRAKLKLEVEQCQLLAEKCQLESDKMTTECSYQSFIEMFTFVLGNRNVYLCFRIQK